MKVIAAFALVGVIAVAYANLESDIAVPVDNTKVTCPIPTEEVVVLPNPKNCSTYYACDLQTPVLMQCPKGLHFNAKEKVCDWPSRACCDPAYDPKKECEDYSLTEA